MKASFFVNSAFSTATLKDILTSKNTDFSSENTLGETKICVSLLSEHHWHVHKGDTLSSPHPLFHPSETTRIGKKPYRRKSCEVVKSEIVNGSIVYHISDS